MNDSLYTPKSLWQDFDADLPLECVTTRQFEDSGAEVTEMYFSGRASEFGRPRIFGTLWRSRADSPEVIVVIGDRTGGISSESYRPLFEHYNVFFFDYAGETGETPKHTYYPNQLAYANARVAGEDFNRAPVTARETPVYEWCAVCRYAVSMALALGFSRVGLLGTGEGGNLAIMTAAFDERVSCVVSCFGGGWERYRANFKYGPNPEPPISEEFSRYVAGCESENYAQNVTQPFLLLSTTNHKRYQMDRVNDTISRIGGAIFHFAPRLASQFDSSFGNNVLLFFDEYLLGGETRGAQVPQMKAEVVGGKLRCRLLGSPDAVASAKVYFSANEVNPAIRDWREAEFVNGECLPELFEGEDTLFLFPQVTYKNGYILSGKLTVLTELSGVSKTSFVPSQVLYTSAMGTDTFTTYSEHAGAVFEEENVTVKKGAFKIDGITDRYNRLATYKVNDARFRFDVDTINFDLCAKRAQTLHVAVYERFNTDGETRYVAEVKALGGDMWQPVTLSAKEFKSEKSALRSFGEVNLLVFASEDEVLFNNILWV